MQYASAEKVADIPRGQYDLLIQEAATRGVISQAEANDIAAMVDAEARKYSAMSDAGGQGSTLQIGVSKPLSTRRTLRQQFVCQCSGRLEHRRHE